MLYDKNTVFIDELNPIVYVKTEKTLYNLEYIINNEKYVTKVNSYFNISDLDCPEGLYIEDLYYDSEYKRKFDFSKLVSDITLYCKITELDDIVITYIYNDNEIEKANNNFASIYDLDSNNLYELYYDKDFNVIYNGELINKDTNIYVKKIDSNIVSYYYNGRLYAKDIIKSGTRAEINNLIPFEYKVYTNKELTNEYKNELIYENVDLYIIPNLLDRYKDSYNNYDFHGYFYNNYSSTLLNYNNLLIKENIYNGSKYNEDYYNNMFLDKNYEYPIEDYYIMNAFNLYTNVGDLFVYYDGLIKSNNNVIGCYYNNKNEEKLLYFDYFTNKINNNELVDYVGRNIVTIIIGNAVYQIALKKGINLTKEDISTFTDGCNFNVYYENNLYDYGNINNDIILFVELENGKYIDSNNNEIIISNINNIDLDRNDYNVIYNETMLSDKPVYEVKCPDYYYISSLSVLKNIDNNDEVLINIGFGYCGNIGNEELTISLSDGTILTRIENLNALDFSFDKYIVYYDEINKYMSDNRASSQLNYYEPRMQFQFNIFEYLNTTDKLYINIKLGDKLLSKFSIEIKDDIIVAETYNSESHILGQ